MSNTIQKLLVLSVDPNKTHDVTPILEAFDWWKEGWTIQQVSLSPYGKDNVQVVAAVVLTREMERRSGGMVQVPV